MEFRHASLPIGDSSKCSRGRQVRGRTLDVGDKSWYPASAMRSMKGNRWRAIRYIWRYHRDRVKGVSGGTFIRDKILRCRQNSG